MKEKFISEIQTFTTDEQIMSALEKVKTFHWSDWEDLMECLKRATIRIQIAKLDEARKKYGL